MSSSMNIKGKCINDDVFPVSYLVAWNGFSLSRAGSLEIILNVACGKRLLYASIPDDYWLEL